MIKFDFPTDNLNINIMRYMSHTGGDFFSQVYGTGDLRCANLRYIGAITLTQYIKTTKQGKPESVICKNQTYPYGIDKDMFNYATRLVMRDSNPEAVQVFDDMISDSIRMNIMKHFFEKVSGRVPGTGDIAEWGAEFLKDNNHFWYSVLNSGHEQSEWEAVLEYLPKQSRYNINFYTLRIDTPQEYRWHLLDAWVKNYTEDFQALTKIFLCQMRALDRNLNSYTHVLNDPFHSSWHERYPDYPDWFDVETAKPFVQRYNNRRLKELQNFDTSIIDTESKEWIDYLVGRYVEDRTGLMEEAYRDLSQDWEGDAFTGKGSSYLK